MSRQGTRLAALLAVAALAFGLAACGGSDSGSSSSTSASTNATTARSDDAGGSGNGQGNGGKSGKSGGEAEKGSGDVKTAPLDVSGGGSDQFRVKGGDNSIQDFGEESDEGELEEAARALHGFYVARARSEWRAACARLSSLVVDQLKQLAERGDRGDTSCPAALAAITPGLPPKVAYETTVVNAGSLRVEGDRGFLIYRGNEKTVYAINMAREDGGWKVGALAGVPLS